jgi:prepilin-type N-terminal cleavage/methylation domain-containing protein
MSGFSHRRGVTLIELAIVLGIIAILAALAVGTLDKVRSRASFSSVTNQVANEVRKARMESLKRGTYTAFIINTNTTGANPLTWYVIQASNTFMTNFRSSGFSPGGCTAPCAIISQGTLPGLPLTSFPASNIGYGSAPPAPFDGVNWNPTSGNKYCSFCLTSGANGWGAIEFSPGGEASFSASNDGTNFHTGQSFTLTSTADSVTRLKIIATIGHTGLIETFEK